MINLVINSVLSMYVYRIVKTLAVKYTGELNSIHLSFFANFPSYARDHAVCGVKVWYLKQAT